MEEYYFLNEIDSLYVFLKILLYIFLNFLLYRALTIKNNRASLALLFLIFISALSINAKLTPMQKDYLSERGMNLKYSEQNTYVNLIRARVIDSLEK